jgi:hypothetical protein
MKPTYRSLNLKLDNQIAIKIDEGLTNLQFKIGQKAYIHIDNELSYQLFRKLYLNLMKLLRTLKRTLDKN